MFERLHDAYGLATKVPDLLKGLASAKPATRKHARERFRAHLVHQGSVFTATLAAIPHVLRLLDAPATREKGELLRLLEEAAIGEHQSWLDRGLPRAPSGRSIAARCHAAVARGRAKYVELLADGDVETRAGAAFVLGWLPAHAKTTIPKLRARLRTEKNDDVAAGLALALGMLGIGARTRGDTAELEAFLTRPEKVRVAAAIARAWLDPRTAPARVREALERAAKSSALRATSIPWNWGDLAGLAKRVLRTLPAKGRIDPDDLLARLRKARSDAALRDEVEDALPKVFPKKAGDATALSESQRTWLSALLARPWRFYRINELLRSRGLPSREDALRAFLGMRPDDPCELRVAVRFGGESKVASVREHWGALVEGRLDAKAFLRGCAALTAEDTIAAVAASAPRALPAEKVRVSAREHMAAHRAKSVELAIRVLGPIAKKNPRSVRAAAKRLPRHVTAGRAAEVLQALRSP